MITSKFFKVGDTVVLTHDLMKFNNVYQLAFIPEYFRVGFICIVAWTGTVKDKNNHTTQVFRSKESLLFYSDAFELVKLDISSPKDVSLNLLRRLRNV